jgi:predicted dinucleotide-binding enzyme
MKKIAIFGSGQAGDALAKGFLDRGHSVRRASRDPEKLTAWKSTVKGDASTGNYADSAAWADIVVFAVKGTAAESVVDQANPKNLAGKTVIDATNPIAEGAPDNGCIRYFTGPNESLMERLQKKAPEANFVKAFNSVGNMFMVSPPFKPMPSMFICGNNDAAKTETSEVLSSFGWEAVDMGGVELARPIEALCQLWCAPGFLKNDWAHAFKYLRLG